jgi:preprotein translocase subunit SecD
MTRTLLALALVCTATIARAAPAHDLHLTFRIDLDKRYDQNQPPELARKRTIQILQQRAGALAEQSRIESHDDIIDVVLPGHEESERAKLTKLVGQPARVHIALIDDENPAMAAFVAKVQAVASAKRDGVIIDAGTAVAKTNDPLYALIRRFGKPPPDRRFAIEGPSPRDPLHYRVHLVPIEPAFQNEDLTLVETAWDPITSRPQLKIMFAAAAAKRLEALTRASIHKSLAIQLDDRIVNAPMIVEPLTTGRATIDLGGSKLTQQQEEAAELAALLKGGCLAAPLIALPRGKK